MSHDENCLHNRMTALIDYLLFISCTRLWKIFYDDKDRPNRYLLAKEQISKPDAEELEVSYDRAGELQSRITSSSLSILFGKAFDSII